MLCFKKYNGYGKGQLMWKIFMLVRKIPFSIKKGTGTNERMPLSILWNWSWRDIKD